MALPNSTIVAEQKTELDSMLYAPDFVLTCANSELVIAIEIDESYAAASNKPIHYILTRSEAKRRNYPHELHRRVDAKKNYYLEQNEFVSIDDIKDSTLPHKKLEIKTGRIELWGTTPPKAFSSREATPH